MQESIEMIMLRRIHEDLTALLADTKGTAPRAFSKINEHMNDAERQLNRAIESVEKAMQVQLLQEYKERMNG